MSRQSISLTEPNASWVKYQIDSREYTSVSDAVNDLIRQARRQEEAKIAKIRAMLIEAEQSIKQQGYSKKTVHDIWQLAREKYLSQHGQI